jgi:hypothetical protein
MFSKLALAVVVTYGCLVSVAYADDPTFTYGKYEEKKKVEYVANASAGLLLATGNSNQITFSAAAMAMRNDGHNKLQLDVSGAYAQSTVLSANDANGNGTIDNGTELKPSTAKTTALWNSKLRYDRFFTENNLGYLAGFAWGNEPAGKVAVYGLQAGYARQLYKSDMHLVQAEIGYDFSAEKLVDPDPMTRLPTYRLHSLRLYGGYTLSASKDTLLTFSVEYLGNMNPYNGPYLVPGTANKKRIGAFGDSRIIGGGALTTRIWKKLSFKFSFTAHYDNVPAPLKAPGGASFGMGFVPASNKLDTLTDASLVVTFL